MHALLAFLELVLNILSTVVKTIVKWTVVGVLFIVLMFGGVITLVVYLLH